MGAVDEYLAGLGPAERSAFEQVVAVARQEAPNCEQGTSYGMAALVYRHKPLLGIRAAKAHLSIFPFSSRAVASVEERLAGFDVSKGTVRFSPERPLPLDAVRALVRHRIAEIDG